jgi:hypothetical protein
MRRPSWPLTVFIGIALIGGACSSPSGSPGASTGGESSTPAGESEAAAASDAPVSDAPPASEAAAASDGGSGEAPALADGPWTGGQGQVSVSGAVEWETDEPITTNVSETTDAKTLLAYNSDDTYVTIFINLTGVPFHASVTAPNWDASSDECEVTYARADDTGIDATFSCVVTEFIYFGVGDEPTGDITIEGSFTATR